MRSRYRNSPFPPTPNPVGVEINGNAPLLFSQGLEKEEERLAAREFASLYARECRRPLRKVWVLEIRVRIRARRPRRVVQKG